MSEIQGDGPTDLHIPDDLTISQFILDTQHPARPVLTRAHPWLIEEATGREIGSDEVCLPLRLEECTVLKMCTQLRARVHGLTNALKIRWNIGQYRNCSNFQELHVLSSWFVQARTMSVGGV